MATGEVGFNEAFELCASSLEHLRIQIEVPREPPWDSHFGPTRRLTCLPSMPPAQGDRDTCRLPVPVGGRYETARDPGPRPYGAGIHYSD